MEGMLGWQGTAAQVIPRAVGSQESTRWSLKQTEEMAEKWAITATNLGHKKQVEDKQDQLSRVCLVVKTHQAWGRLEGFAKSGAESGVFDGHMLREAATPATNLDWSLMQDLVQQASTAAVGRGDSEEAYEEDMVELMA